MATKSLNTRRVASLLALYLISSFVISCKDGFIDIFRDDSIVSDIPENEGVANAINKAKEFALISWTPISDVPNNSGYFEAGKTVTGLPYSSTKEIDKYIGTNVSVVTFMTAVHNPRSVLYTENIKKAPYHGSNCASYYGVVCSSVINYALGLGVDYSTAMLDTLSVFERIQNQDPTGLKLCDVLLSSGHEVMVIDIKRDVDDSSIASISTFEASGTGTHLKSYFLSEFIERWKRDNWVAYRYKNIEKNVTYTKNPFVSADGTKIATFPYNEIMCLNRGDYAVFREGEEIIIDVFDPVYDKVRLFRDGSQERIDGVKSGTIAYDSLGYGKYTAVAFNDRGNTSDEIHFEVVDTFANATVSNNSVRVSFHSEYGTPKYVAFCDLNGSKRGLRVLNQNDIVREYTDMDFPNGKKEVYCKVYFSAENGIVTNEPFVIKSK